MKYTIVLTEKSDGGIHVSIPALPDCHVEAATRDEAIKLARKAITETIRRSEIVHLDVPQQPKLTSPDETPWDWFGATQDDSTWGRLFEEIEKRRDATRARDK